MKKPFGNAILVLILISVLIGGCRAGDPTQQPTAQPPATAPAATEPAAPQVTETATEAPTRPITATDEPTSEPTPPRQSDVNWDDRSIFRAGLVGSAQETLDDLPGASVYHIDLRIASDLMSLQGHQQVRYTNQEGEPLDEVYFQLFPNTAGGAVTVSAVQVDGQAVESAYEYQNSALHVLLPTALQLGEQTVIQMDFEVQVAREMAGNFGLFGYFDGVLVLDGFYPVIPVYDDEGWNVQDPPSQGDVTYFDASFYRVQVTAPAELMVVASGIQVSHEESGGEQVLVFVAGPARDFYLAASDDFTVLSQTVGETTINSYTFPERAQGAELALRFAADAISSFSERLGPYPYTEFDVINAPMLALGIEYPGMTSIALTLYDPDAEVVGLPSQVVLESTVAHEVGHQWFYNVVGNDQVDEPWMDEAIVQYVTGLYFLDVYGEQSAQGYRASWYDRWDRVERADIPIGLPAEAYADNAYGAIVYGRGPLFVAALAEEMGQEMFDAFLRDYYQSHQWGIGTGESFRQLAEQHCDCDLSALFEEWVYELRPEASKATESVAAGNTWIKTYEGGQDDVGWDVLLADDGGYFIVGTTNLQFEPEMQGDIYLIRTDAVGEVLWEKTYGGQGYEEGRTIFPSDDGGLMIAGWTASFGAGGLDAYLIKVDQDGNEMWSKTFGGPLDEMAVAWPMADGGYLIGGNIVDPNDVVADPGAAGYGGLAGRSNVYLARTDADGNELWSCTFGGENNVLATGGVQTPDGGFLILATILHYPENDDDIWLLKVDKNGDEVWSRTWEQGTTNGDALIQTSDGNYLISGSYAPPDDVDGSKLDFLFIQVDPEGNELWMNTFGDPNSIDDGKVLTEASTGGYVAAGGTGGSFASWDEDIAIVKIDENGQLGWERIIETATHNMFGAILRHPDGGYVLVGSTFRGRNFDVFMIKTDSEGNVE